MKTTIDFRGQQIEFNHEPQSNLISSCTHWELILDLIQAGVVERDRGGTSATTPNCYLVQSLDHADILKAQAAGVTFYSYSTPEEVSVFLTKDPATFQDYVAIYKRGEEPEFAPISC